MEKEERALITLQGGSRSDVTKKKENCRKEG